MHIIDINNASKFIQAIVISVAKNVAFYFAIRDEEMRPQRSNICRLQDVQSYT